MNIALWKRVTNYFKIEIINFMRDTSYKFVIDNTDRKIQKGVLFLTTNATFKKQCVVVYVFGNGTKIVCFDYFIHLALFTPWQG